MPDLTQQLQTQLNSDGYVQLTQDGTIFGLTLTRGMRIIGNGFTLTADPKWPGTTPLIQMIDGDNNRDTLVRDLNLFGVLGPGNGTGILIGSTGVRMENVRVGRSAEVWEPKGLPKERYDFHTAIEIATGPNAYTLGLHACSWWNYSFRGLNFLTGNDVEVINCHGSSNVQQVGQTHNMPDCSIFFADSGVVRSSHFWGIHRNIFVLNGAGSIVDGCQFEGGDSSQVLLLGTDNVMTNCEMYVFGKDTFTNDHPNACGLQLGDSQNRARFNRIQGMKAGINRGPNNTAGSWTFPGPTVKIVSEASNLVEIYQPDIAPTVGKKRVEGAPSDTTHISLKTTALNDTLLTM